MTENSHNSSGTQKATTPEDFLFSRQDHNSSVPYQTTEAPPPGREAIKHILIGSAKTVTSTIHALQVLGYAEAGLWSPLIPSPSLNPGEVMSILVRYILVQ